MAANKRTFTVEITDTRSGSGIKDTAEQTDSLKSSLDKAGSSADGLDRSLSGAGGSSRSYADGLDRAGESADGAETRFTGLASGIDGVTTLMDDPSPQEFAQGLADMADGIGNFVVPTIKTMATQLLATGRAAVTSAVQHVAAAAKTVASWVLMGVQAMINAAKMAAAWLISLGPIGLVIAAVAAVIAILVALGVGFDDLKRWAVAAWQFIWDKITAVFGWLKANWPLVLAILTGPIGIAVLMIVRHWDTIKNAFGAVMGWIGDRAVGARDWIVGVFRGLVDWFRNLPGSIANAASGMFQGIADAFKSAINWVIDKWNNFEISWGGFNPPGPGSIPGFTINTPNIPRLAEGGIVPATPGGRMAVIGEGPYDEAVVPLKPGIGMGGGETVINLDMRGAVIASERQFEDMVVRAFRAAAGKGIPLTLRGRTI